MVSLRRRLVGAALLAVAAAAFGLAATVSPAVVPAAGTPDLVVPSPASLLAAPALLAGGSVLLVSGGATLLDADLSARTALLAPAFGAVSALALGTGIGTESGAPIAAFAASEALATLSTGPPGTTAAGAAVGATVAPVVRAATTEDTIALLVAATLLLVSTATASAEPLALAAGGVAGVLAVGALWAVDPTTWRP